ncbi:hypothetical protein DFP73DRAFT_554329 [Morchella snyderi]|nr:hypothetical protein DFP73DRAFT_554329 [Morchella snyderi]
MPTRTPAPATTTNPAYPRLTHRSHNSTNRTPNSSNRASALGHDNNTCVLTGIQPPYPLHLAHIIPFSVRDAKADAFWGFLSIFLGSGGAGRVRRVTLQLAEGRDGAGDGGAEGRDARERQGGLANCMALELRSHGLYDNSLIEMLPVPGSGT